MDNKYIEEASDVNVEGIEFYVKNEADGFLYFDAECTKKVDTKTLDHSFRMNDIVIIDNGMACRAIGLTVGEDDVTVSYLTITEDDNEVISTPKQVKSFDAKLLVDVDIAADENLFNKFVADLQSNIVVGDGKITGELKYVTGYTGFSGNPEEQSGNYLALHNTTNTGEPIIVEIIGGFSGPVQLDPDGLIVLKIANNDQVVKVTSGDLVKEFSLKELTLATE